MNSFIFSFSMKKFLIKIVPYFLAILIVLAILGSYADGNTDDNYMHFAVKKPQNIILGDSRGSQGVVPGVLKRKLSADFDNFSLNIMQSPYGQVYFKALKRKLAPETKNGIFILTVNPWSLSIGKNIKKEKDFPEEHSPLNDMHFYDYSPNYEYLLKHYTRSWFKIYTERAEAGRSNTFLHDDGWLEVNVNMHADSVAVRTKAKTIFYTDLAKGVALSPERLRAFNEIINYLRTKGSVYIVRIPTSENLTAIENGKYPHFSKLLQDIAHQQNVKVFDFSKNYADYDYTDGNHMYKESSKKLTSQIADSIVASRKK
ncbi:hypothetical protein EG347_16160 [Chryseobacterium sp. G0186]|uniref:hypothetical protein n=1 Tax=Chryseobacterium sp. G0186 TaxID=2487064 RepID=UPI000F4E15C7|nr:hypothetical protein [Chryseobacterium sp. G0186]AZA78937.1 hypothetical protein EG347_16160 [Chryseobacterium sp. G0186]